MKKILFTDLDGTLLNDAKEISSRNREMLEKALAMGHKIVITTGRPLSSAIAQYQKLGLQGEGNYLISFNGAVIYDCHREEVIQAETFDIPTAIAIIRLCDAHKMHVQTYDMQQVLVEPRCVDAELADYHNRIGATHRVLQSFDAELDCQPPKVLAIGKREELEQLQKALTEKFSQVADSFFSAPHLLEIVVKGMNKGTAIAWLCNKLGMDISQSIAAGDAENDLSMIEAAGLGVAMCNGEEVVKKAADYITERDNNKDGIAEIVEKFMLSED